MGLTLLNLPSPPALTTPPSPSTSPSTPAPPSSRTRSILRASSAPFDSSSASRRSKSWSHTNDSINTILEGNHDRLRAYCRDAVRKSPWAKSIIESYTANAIGTGIKPLSQHQDEKVRAAIHKAWRRWTDDADFDGKCDLYGLQSLAFREMMEAGEVLVRIHIDPDTLSNPLKSSPIPIELQILESDHLPYHAQLMRGKTNLPEGHDIRYGVEFNPRGKRVAYHLYREHPGENQSLSSRGLSWETERIPAEEILHIFKPIRAGQVRGQPHLTQVLLALRDLDEYTDAARLRKKISSLFAGFVTKPSVGDVVTTENQGNGIGEAEVEAGTLFNLLPGEGIEWSNPPEEADFESFVKTNLRAIAIGADVTYEQLTGDLEKVNYSSIRAGLLEFRRKCEQMQHQVFAFQFCRPIFRIWFRFAILSGALKIPYFSVKDQEEFMDVKWITPGWPWVDPDNDSKAATNDVRSGFTSRAAVVAARGEDVEEIDAEQAADNKRADRLGLPYDSDSRKELKVMDKQSKNDQKSIETQGEIQKEINRDKPQPQPSPKPSKSNGKASEYAEYAEFTN